MFGGIIRLWSSDCTNIAQFTDLKLQRCKGNATDPHTWILFPTNFALASSLWRRSRCRSRHFWRLGSRIISSSRMSSRIHSPNSVLWETLFFSVIGLCPRMYWHKIAAAVAAAAAAFQEAGVLPASWRQRFPDARLKIYLRFNVVRILWAILVMLHGRLSRFAPQIIEVFFFFAQWWTVIHNSRLVRIRIRHSELFNDGLVLEDDFEFTLATFHWWQPSTISLMIVPI